MFKDLTIQELLEARKNKKITLIDVRSPSEYKTATIPGSINIPIFTDEERGEIGTIYKQVNVEAAKERGLEIVSAKLPQFIKEFSMLEGDRVVFCWRGGMRSKTSATVVDLMGIPVSRLQGGVRSYRRWVVKALEESNFTQDAFVLNGYTGSGKTTILRRLKKQGFPVLDLEQMANHRGSIFGQIGLTPNNQKMFEALLIEEMQGLENSPYFLIEAESQRIGKIMLPQWIMDKKENGIQFFIDMPLEIRALNILEEYRPWEHAEECMISFQKIKRRIHTPIAAQIEKDLELGRYESAVQMLLAYYYDPRYEHTASQYPKEKQMRLKVSNIEEAANAIRELMDSKLKIRQ
ncbi:tRNA 2-selenouridine(34) synthase MnmH [Falsibacillus pallidus]|uniref:tRNA 2-selenouridine synthase n=1 Tax=Falsibacillus pallidus TaxID=493781 RepID=A0A370GQ72_9BACI|nr:tRNA 2-selenouridine(34) synthase MnmH [Falsibacillus pallidus]RDI45661.1 tRNA 2-selenouridine synthase [Falsibacillus pallidus]